MAVDRRVGGGGFVRRKVTKPAQTASKSYVRRAVHKVKSTDSIGSIAAQAGTTPKLILSENPSVNGLSTGINLRIPITFHQASNQEPSLGGRGGDPRDFGIDQTVPRVPAGFIQDSNQPSIGGGRGGDPRDFGIQNQSPFPLPPPLPPPDNEGGGGGSGGSSGGKGGGGGSATRPQLEPAGTPSFFRQLGQWKIATG